MFDLIFDALSAWNQIGLLLMGTVFILIGGSIAGYELYWRIKSTKIKARITGIKVTRQAKNKSTLKKKEDETEEESETLSESFKKEPVASSFGMLFVLLFFGMPLVFSGIGAYMGYTYLSLTQTGEYAQAKVVRNDSSYDSENGTSYKAVLKFTDHQGKIWEVKDTISYGNSPSFKKGTQIGVYYRADDPKKFVIDDFWHNMALSLILFFFGFAFIGIVALACFVSTRQNQAGEISHKDGKKPNFADEVYYAVFEYQAPNGNRMEKVSESGSNSLLGKMPGRRVTVMTFPDNPEKIRRPFALLFVFGLIFLVPGVLIMHTALTTFEFNIVTLLIVLGGLGFIAFKVWSFFRQIPSEDLKNGWAEFKEKGVSVKASTGSGKGGRLLEPEEVAVRAKYYAKHSMIAGYVMLVIALGLAGGSYYAGLDMVDMTQNGISATGKVVDMRSRYSDGSYTYSAVVEFRDRDGNKSRFTDSVGSSHSSFKRGDEVEVLYMRDNPDDAIIDRGIFNWGLSGGLAIGVLLLLWGAFHSLALARRYGGSRYRSRM